MNLKLTDLLTGTLAGALIASATFYAIPAGWNMALAMAAGGLLGMVFKFILMIPLIPFFGAFETMIPLSIIGMAAGMAGGMAATYDKTPPPCISLTGAAIGLTVALIIFYSNRRHLGGNNAR